MNNDLGTQHEIDAFGVRSLRLAPGQANTRLRHRHEAELQVLLEGLGRLRVDDRYQLPPEISARGAAA